MDKKTDEKWALVTGASTGIGREFARILGSQGYSLIITARSAEKLESLKYEIQTNHAVQVGVIHGDLSEPTFYNSLPEATKNWTNSIDLLVNNAGIGDMGEFAKSDLQKQIRMIRINIEALTVLTRVFVEKMLNQKKGKILNVASTASFQSGPFMSVYYATKAFVLFFSEALAYELKGTGVHVTTLCPGATESEFAKGASLTNSKLFNTRKLPSSREVAEFGLNALEKKKIIAVHGFVNWILTMSVRFTPRWLLAWIVKTLHSSANGTVSHSKPNPGF